MQPRWDMIIPLAAGYVADLLLGDPRGWPHPVRWFGWLIAAGERLLNRGRWRFWKGLLLTLGLCVPVYFSAAWLLSAAKGGWLYYLLSGIIVFFCLANRSLLQEGQAVFDVLKNEGLEAGRRRLAWIVGRDTGELSAQQVRIAVLESMSENLSDGVVAPLLFFLVGGAPAMLTYKMINTLDSMIGYKREPYRFFGRTAARLDDVANFIPARVTALLMALMTFSGHALRFAFRYGRAHASPNSGWPEAALAGILDCRFGGPNRYKGALVEKPYIGECERVITHVEFGRVKYVNHAVTLFVVVAEIIYFL
ncbi:adenosylcobinamide-phosphate synthase CbiB [Puia sp.]|jgi:adenosylcobinamide-phosphate synthase|uniref:adenosylcobinamide-phosphate synthase CbiB n=1 Tax=Puia sp. TaxID=2045100 RepID=UPI002F3F3427